MIKTKENVTTVRLSDSFNLKSFTVPAAVKSVEFYQFGISADLFTRLTYAYASRVRF
jgi:hypothetical protein